MPPWISRPTPVLLQQHGNLKGILAEDHWHVSVECSMMSLQEGNMPGIGKSKSMEETRGMLRVAAQECSSLAMRQAKEKGLTVMVAQGNRIVKLAPDGTWTEVKKIDSPSVHLAKGLKVNYR
jgi:hypothetical protein